MAVTVKQISSALSMTQQETISFLRELGIIIFEENAVLTDEQLRILNEAIERGKQEAASSATTEQAASIVVDEQVALKENAHNHLVEYLRNHKVFIDTCSLLHMASDQFWSHAVPVLQQTGNKIIVPTRAIDELRKHSSQEHKPELARKAQETIQLLEKLLKSSLIELRGEQTDNFVDNVFQVVFTKFRMTHKLLLITQDVDLAKDILNLNNIKSVRANPVYVKRINRFGYLSNFNKTPTKEITNESPRTSAASKEPTEEITDQERFSLSTGLTTVSDQALTISHLPEAGDRVIAYDGHNMNEIELQEAVASGGEGTIYLTNTPYVAKIYKKDNINKRRQEKISLMLSKKVKFEGICYPIASIYNLDKQFVGYLMPKAEGKELQKSLFIKPLLLKNFPTWKKRDTVELCVTILEKIKYLHDRNIILGDINPCNILVVSPKEVYFVDNDSYQIEGFPCPVGTINYTAPEIQRKSFDSFLRTLGNEYFAVATLLFMIMLPGKPPYSQQGGESPINNVISMNFSYPFGEQSNRKTPDGPWRFIWSHLPYDIKEAFYQTLRKDGENSEEQNRLTVDEWLQKFKYYLHLLDSGKFGEQDKMSEELFPTRHKKNPKVTYVDCRFCGTESPEESCKSGICRECLNQGEVYHCGGCGEELIYTNYQRYIRNAKRHEQCSSCFEKQNLICRSQNCIGCGIRFDLTYRQVDYYESKGFDLPRRCEDCRKNRYSHSRPTFESVRSSGNMKSGGGLFGCFITTAVCEYFNKADDCYELTTLRAFRDNWLKLEPNGEELISEYYEIAPDIVKQIEMSSKKDAIYHELYESYIMPCISYIENEEYQRCKETYVSMMNALKIRATQIN